METLIKAFFVFVFSTNILGACCVAQSSGQSPLDQLRKKAHEIVRPKPQRAGLTDEKIVTGLKQALSISTNNAVSSTGRTDGFLKNEAIKILVPEKLRRVSKTMRMVGMGRQVDEFETGMNRAAEQATPAARAIFLNALANMTFQDARQILSGGDTAATEYFRRASTQELAAAFAPIVHRSLENVGVIRQYNQLTRNPIAARATGKDFNLDDYVVGKTLDGLFFVMGREEQKIRKDPMAQTTAILREVFGKEATSGQ